MKTFKYELTKLEKILRIAYYEKEKYCADAQWQINVMHCIRNLESFGKTDIILLFDSVVWRFALGACFLAVILSAYLLQTGFQPEYEIAKFFLDDPAAFAFLNY